jgi:hypothetical protein
MIVTPHLTTHFCVAFCEYHNINILIVHILIINLKSMNVATDLSSDEATNLNDMSAYRDINPIRSASFILQNTVNFD